MSQSITADQVVGAAKDLGKDEFTRADLASKLGVKRPEIKSAFKEARRAGRLDKSGEDSEGTGQFRLTES
jgi:DNA-binding transcriptional regulator LsrR (DeoR family)